MATSAQAMSTRDAVERRLRSGGGDARGLVLEGALLLSLLIALGVLVVLVGDILIRSFPVFAERPLEFLTSPLSSRPANAGIVQGILGSVMLMAFVAVIALPLGVGAAIYLEEYAHDTWLTRLIRTNIRNLAGVPAIVYGLLGLALFVSTLGLGKSLIAGGLTLAVLVLPIVGDHDVGGAARRAEQHPRGGLRRRCHALGDGPQPRGALRRAGHPDRHHPDAGPRLRRDGAAPDGRGHRRNLQQRRHRGHADRVVHRPSRRSSSTGPGNRRTSSVR